MILDFGERTPNRGVPVEKFCLAAAAALVLALPVTFLLQWRHTVPEARYWSPAGPPCPQLSAQDFRARRLETPDAFDFRGVVLGQRFGHASCRMIRDRGGRGIGEYPVCQFTGPAAVTVTTKGGTAYYAPGVGQPVTISVQHGKARCVMASHYNLEEGVPE